MREVLFVSVMSAVVIILVVTFFFISKRNLSLESERLKKIMGCCKKTDSSAKIVSEIFSVVASYIKAEEYSFYLFDNKNKLFVLKSVHYKNTSDGSLNLSYSGLVPVKKVTFAFPVTVSADEIKDEISLSESGKMKILSIPIKGGNALLQLKMDEKFKLNSGVLKTADKLAKGFEPVVSLVVSLEKLNDKIKVLEAAKQATRSVASIISSNGIFKMAIGMFTRTINAKGGFFIRDSEHSLEVDVETGISKENSLMFKYDSELHAFFKQILGEKKIATLNKKDAAFSNIPVYFASEGVKQIILFNVNFGENKGIAGFWYDQAYEIDDYQTSSLLLMFSKISDVFKRSFQISTHSQSNIETLKLISTLVDDLSPYTVGFSYLMEYYATAIAQELKLGQTEVENIALAAFLSNIGISMLSYDIFLAKGKYMEYDYEVIKLHSEVGADIIEAIYGDLNVANMVRYHHERIDGFGYPHRLKGADIPIGAKVLAVAQFFIAKISPRTFREASTYEEATEALKQVAGTQLDADIVYAFLGWIERTRAQYEDCDCSLDYCWNMRCVSAEICNKCPAKMKKDKRCWEAEGNACMAHGNKCETCFIYTEYLGRKNRVRSMA
ncbi:MAG: Cyclic di-GMP phosphodiesterase response regulator RpfG [Firmicutes bacterium ADurb.Bin193]|nr:MAG: Cyclic di-GMP phosphodiesterase response regulator RpfG [Firmicutes bacterium ADurb.Bin193]